MLRSVSITLYPNIRLHLLSVFESWPSLSRESEESDSFYDSHERSHDPDDSHERLHDPDDSDESFRELDSYEPISESEEEEDEFLVGDFSSHPCNRDCTVPNLKSLTCKFTLTVELLYTDQDGRRADGRNRSDILDSRF